MRVAKDAVDADILVNNKDTSISCALRYAVFCKSLYKFINSFALNSEYLNDFLIIIEKIFTDELWDCGWMYPDKCGDIWMWGHLWKSTLVGGEKPAAGINASSSGKCQQIDFSGIAACYQFFICHLTINF